MVRAERSEALIEVARAIDVDASLQAKRFLVTREIISRGFLVELKVPSILVATGESVELGKLFEEMKLRVARKFGTRGSGCRWSFEMDRG